MVLSTYEQVGPRVWTAPKTETNSYQSSTSPQIPGKACLQICLVTVFTVMLKR